MAAIPSIKGSVLVEVIEDVARTLERGAISESEAGRWLRPGDQKLIRSPISISSWYDIAIYVRMNELLRDVEGGGSNEYLRGRGRETARRLLQSGLYVQLEFLHHMEVHETTGPRARFEAFGRDLRKLATLSGSILNFSRWSAKPDPEVENRYRIEVAEAEHLPEVFCWRAEGFINLLATRHDRDNLWRWDRESPDRVVFRMLREL